LKQERCATRPPESATKGWEQLTVALKNLQTQPAVSACFGAMGYPVEARIIAFLDLERDMLFPGSAVGSNRGIGRAT